MRTECIFEKASPRSVDEKIPYSLLWRGKSDSLFVGGNNIFYKAT